MTDGLTPHEIQLLNEIDPRSFLAKLGDKINGLYTLIDQLNTTLSALSDDVAKYPRLLMWSGYLRGDSTVDEMVNCTTDFVFGNDTPAQLLVVPGPYDLSEIEGDLTFELYIGTDESPRIATIGEDDAADLSAVTTAELITVLTRDIEGISITEGDTSFVITDTTAVGFNSSLTIGAGTINTALNLTEGLTRFGSIGFGSDITTVEGVYYPVVTPTGPATPSVDITAVTFHMDDQGFKVYCSTEATKVSAHVIVVIPQLAEVE